jgi:hypothetical protein
MLVGAVDGVGFVAVEALGLMRNVLVSAVSGAANIGVEAVDATVAGTRGVVTAASRAVAEITRAAQGAVQTSVDNARQAGRSAARTPRARSFASMNDQPTDGVRLVRSNDAEGGRRGRARGRGVKRVAQPRVAA